MIFKNKKADSSIKDQSALYISRIKREYQLLTLLLSNKTYGIKMPILP